MAARSPTRMTEAPNSLTAATAPATTTAGPWSPPIASTAIFIRAGWPFALAIFMAGASGSTTPLRRRRSPGPCSSHSAGTRGAGACFLGTAGTPSVSVSPACSACGASAHASWSVVVSAVASSSLLVWQPCGQVLEDGQTRVRRSRRARARDHVSIAAAEGTEPKAPFAAERLHGKGEGGFRLDQRAEIELVLFVEVDVQVVGKELDGVAGGRTRNQAHVDRRRRRRRQGLEAAAARLRDRRAELSGHEDVETVPLDAQLHVLETPARVPVH